MTLALMVLMPLLLIAIVAASGMALALGFLRYLQHLDSKCPPKSSKSLS